MVSIEERWQTKTPIRLRQESIRPLPSVGRARGPIAIWEQARREEEMGLRKGGIWTPMSETLGQGRVATLSWLCEEATYNVVRAPGPIPQQQKRGRGRGLTSLLHNHPYPPYGRGLNALLHNHPYPSKCMAPVPVWEYAEYPTQSPAFRKSIQIPISQINHIFKILWFRVWSWFWLKFSCALEFLCWSPTLKSILGLFNLNLYVFGIYDWNLWSYYQHTSITIKRQQPDIETI